VSEVLLEIRDLHKRYGGVNASDGIDLSVIRGELHALIGPNGAGKTTLIAQLSGLTKPDSGRVMFKQKDITALPAHQRVKLGLARSFQITSIFPEMSVHENAAVAVQASRGHSFKFWKQAKNDKARRQSADQVLEQVGLADRRDLLASQLSHGERRQLEIAMALATDPELLLLDEPMAGMGKQESDEMIALLRRLKSVKTILLVEHDMDVVFALADRISVLVYGKVVACDTPQAIKQNALVRQAYLGDS